MTPRRFALLLLAVAGALAGHWIGTALAAPTELVDHSYLGITGAIVTPMVVVALGWLALRGARTVGLVDIDLRWLLALQVAVFVAQESVELTSAGIPLTQFVTEPAILLGLAAQIPVALLIVVAVRVATHLAAAFIDRPCRPFAATVAHLSSAVGWLPHPVVVRVHGPRGPPRVR